MSITDDLRTDLTNARTRHRSDAKRIEFLEAENERLREALLAVVLDSGVGYLQTELQDRIAALVRVDDNSAR